MLLLVLLISTSVAHSMADSKLWHLGMANVASPKTGYRHLDQKSFAISSQSYYNGPNVNIPVDLVVCANRRCGISKHNHFSLQCQILQQSVVHCILPKLVLQHIKHLNKDKIKNFKRLSSSWLKVLKGIYSCNKCYKIISLSTPQAWI